jgi:hypothetical protein
VNGDIDIGSPSTLQQAQLQAPENKFFKPLFEEKKKAQEKMSEEK